MSFKENLLKKIAIDTLTGDIQRTIGPVGSERRIDKALMRNLLDMGPFTHRKDRDLDLYIFKDPSGNQQVLVLDNDLPIYKTSIEDVVIRKSPIVKEMLNIRNVIKILNDSDVVISKKELSLKTVQQQCIAQLDLAYGKQDIIAIKHEGLLALNSKNHTDLETILSLFFELLDYIRLLKDVHLEHYILYGGTSRTVDGSMVYGPIVIFNEAACRLKLINSCMKITDKEQVSAVLRVAMGKEDAFAEDGDVLNFLAESAIDLNKQY